MDDEFSLEAILAEAEADGDDGDLAGMQGMSAAANAEIEALLAEESDEDAGTGCGTGLAQPAPVHPSQVLRDEEAELEAALGGVSDGDSDAGSGADSAGDGGSHAPPLTTADGDLTVEGILAELGEGGSSLDSDSSSDSRSDSPGLGDGGGGDMQDVLASLPPAWQSELDSPGAPESDAQAGGAGVPASLPPPHNDACVMLAPMGMLVTALADAGGGLVAAAAEFTTTITAGGNTSMASPLSLHRQEDPHSVRTGVQGRGGALSAASHGLTLGPGGIPLVGGGAGTQYREGGRSLLRKGAAAAVRDVVAEGVRRELTGFGMDEGAGDATAALAGGAATGVIRMDVLPAISSELLKGNTSTALGFGRATCVATSRRFIGLGTTRSVVLVYDHYQQQRAVLSRAGTGAASGRRTATDGHVTALHMVTTAYAGFLGRDKRLDLLAAGFASGRVTVFDVTRGTTVVDIEPPASSEEGAGGGRIIAGPSAPVTAVRFVSGWERSDAPGVVAPGALLASAGTDDAPPPALVVTDARGSVHLHTVSFSSFWRKWSVESVCLMDGARSGPTLALSVLLPSHAPSTAAAAVDSRTRGASRVRLQASSAQGGSGAADATAAALPVTDLVALANTGTLLAITRSNATHIVSLAPPIMSCFVWGKPPDAPDGVLPVTAWGRARVRGFRVQCVALPAFAADADAPPQPGGRGRRTVSAYSTASEGSGVSGLEGPATVPSIVGVATTFALPVLARAWGRHLQLLQVQPRGGFHPDFTTPYYATAPDPARPPLRGPEQLRALEPVLGRGHVWLVPTDDVLCSAPIVSLAWLGESHLAILTCDLRLMVLDTITLRELDVTSTEHVSLVTAAREAMLGVERGQATWGAAAPGKDSTTEVRIGATDSLYPSAFPDGDGRLFLLGENSLHAVRLQTWRQRVSVLADDNQWMPALALAQDHFVAQFKDAMLQLMLAERRARAQSPDGRLRDAERAYLAGLRANPVPHTVMDEVKGVLVRYVSSVVEHAPDAALQPGQLPNPKLPEVYSSIAPEFLSHWRMQAAVCIDYCVGVGCLDLLFTHIFDRFKAAGRAPTGLFLETLEPYILNDRVSTLDPTIMQALVGHYASIGNLSAVERCLLHLSLATLDTNFAIKLCLAHRLFCALIAVFSRGLVDYVTPLDILLCACVPYHPHVAPGTHIPEVPLALLSDASATKQVSAGTAQHALSAGTSRTDTPSHRQAHSVASILAEMDSEAAAAAATAQIGSRPRGRRRLATTAGKLLSKEERPTVYTAADAVAAQLLLYLYHTAEGCEFPWGRAQEAGLAETAQSQVVAALWTRDPDRFPAVSSGMLPAKPMLVGEEAVVGREGGATGREAPPPDPSLQAVQALPGPYPRLQGLALANMHGFGEFLDALAKPLLVRVREGLVASLNALLQGAPVARTSVCTHDAAVASVADAVAGSFGFPQAWAAQSVDSITQAWLLEERSFVYRYVPDKVAPGVAAQLRALFGGRQLPCATDPACQALDEGDEEAAARRDAMPTLAQRVAGADPLPHGEFMGALHASIGTYLPPLCVPSVLGDAGVQRELSSLVAPPPSSLPKGSGGAAPAPRKGGLKKGSRWGKVGSMLGKVAAQQWALWEQASEEGGASASGGLGSDAWGAEDVGAPLYLFLARLLSALPRPYPFPTPRLVEVARADAARLHAAQATGASLADVVDRARASTQVSHAPATHQDECVAGVEAYGADAGGGSTVAHAVFAPPEGLLRRVCTWLALRAAVWRVRHAEDPTFAPTTGREERTVVLNVWQSLLLRVLVRCPPRSEGLYRHLVAVVSHPAIALPRVEALLHRLEGVSGAAVAAFLRDPDRAMQAHALLYIRDEALCAQAEAQATTARAEALEAASMSFAPVRRRRVLQQGEVGALLGMAGAGGGGATSWRRRTRSDSGDSSDTDHSEDSDPAHAARQRGFHDDDAEVTPSSTGAARLAFIRSIVLGKLSDLVKVDADGTARVVVERFPGSVQKVLTSLQQAADGRLYEFRYRRQLMGHLAKRQRAEDDRAADDLWTPPSGASGQHGGAHGSPTPLAGAGVRTAAEGGSDASEGPLCFAYVPALGGDAAPLPPLGFDCALTAQIWLGARSLQPADPAGIPGPLRRYVAASGMPLHIVRALPLTLGWTPSGLEVVSRDQHLVGMAIDVARGRVLPPGTAPPAAAAAAAAAKPAAPDTHPAKHTGLQLGRAVQQVVSGLFGGADRVPPSPAQVLDAAPPPSASLRPGTMVMLSTPPVWGGVYGQDSMDSLMAHSSISITPELHLRYVELLCEFAPGEVLPYLQQHEDVPLEATLGVLSRTPRHEATAFILERKAAPLSALAVLVQALAGALDALRAPLSQAACRIAVGLISSEGGEGGDGQSSTSHTATVTRRDTRASLAGRRAPSRSAAHGPSMAGRMRGVSASLRPTLQQRDFAGTAAAALAHAAEGDAQQGAPLEPRQASQLAELSSESWLQAVVLEAQVPELQTSLADFHAQLQFALDLCQRNTDEGVLLAGGESIRQRLRLVAQQSPSLLAPPSTSPHTSHHHARGHSSHLPHIDDSQDLVHGACLWLALLDSLVALQQDTAAAAAEAARFRGYDDVSESDSRAIERASSAASDLTALRASEELLRQSTMSVLDAMRRVLPLDMLLEKVLRQYGAREYGAFRDTIQGMLGAYGYEQSILRTAKDLIAHNVFERIKELHTSSGRGVASGPPGTYAGGLAQMLRAGLTPPRAAEAGPGDFTIVLGTGVSALHRDENGVVTAVTAAQVEGGGLSAELRARRTAGGSGRAGSVGADTTAVEVVGAPSAPQLRGAGHAFAGVHSAAPWETCRDSVVLTLARGGGGRPGHALASTAHSAAFAAGSAATGASPPHGRSRSGTAQSLPTRDVNAGGAADRAVLDNLRARQARAKPLSDIFSNLARRGAGDVGTAAALHVQAPDGMVMQLGAARTRQRGEVGRMSTQGFKRGTMTVSVGDDL